MANIILSWVNLIAQSGTVLSASGASGNMPIENISDPRPGKRWRASSTSDYGQAVLSSDQEAGIFALRFPRDVTLPGGAVRHYLDLASGTAGAGVVDDSTAISLGLVDGYGYHVWTPSAARTFAQWRFQFAATGVGALDVGLAWAWASWSPTNNVEYGMDDAWEDLSAGTQGVRSGSMFFDKRPKRRKFAFSLGAILTSERDTVRELQRIAGTSSQVLAVIDPDDAPKQTIIGTLTQVSPLRYTNFNLSSKAFEITESI